MVTYEARRAFQSWFTPAPMPEPGAPIEDVKVSAQLLGLGEAREAHARLPALDARRGRETQDATASACRASSTCTRRARSSARTSKRSGSTSATSSSATRRPRRCSRRAASTAPSTPAIPSKVVQAHIHHFLFDVHPRAPARRDLLPDPHARAELPRRLGRQRRVPDRRRHAGRDESRVHEGGRLLRHAQHRVPRSGAELRGAVRMKQTLFETWGERLGVTEDESDFAVEQGLCALAEHDRDVQHKGRAILDEIEAENRVAILMIGRPYHLDPGLHHGIPDEFQVLGYPILSMRSIPKDPAWLARYFDGRRAAERPRRLARELLGEQRDEGLGREVRRPPPERGAARHLELQVRSRRADVRHHRSHRRTRSRALLGAPRSRREQAWRVDQDPRQDVRALAQAPRGATRGRRREEARARAAHRPRSGSSCSR